MNLLKYNKGFVENMPFIFFSLEVELDEKFYLNYLFLELKVFSRFKDFYT
jgi:hypothetical protein